MTPLERRTEALIKKAEAEGQFRNLPGAGKPLPDRPGDAFVTPADAIGYRIMAEAGVVPEEFRLKAEAEALRARLAGVTDPEARKALMAELSAIELKRAIAEEARRKFLR